MINSIQKQVNNAVKLTRNTDLESSINIIVLHNYTKKASHKEGSLMQPHANYHMSEQLVRNPFEMKGSIMNNDKLWRLVEEHCDSYWYDLITEW